MSSKTPASFATSVTIPASDLSIEIGGMGALELPLREATIKSIVAQCKPAQYGFREQTIQDDSVRKTWELESFKIKICGSKHDEVLATLLEQIKSDIGLEKEATLKAELHNLLVYEKGNFFKPHQDTEKKKGMVATLSITLPSSHTGGALLVHHNGVTKKFYSSKARLDRIYCAAFYADCIHEVKPLTSGYRVVLTFNLILEREINLPNSYQIKSIDSLKYVSLIKQHIKAAEDFERRPYVVYLLDHQYTKLSFGWSVLKKDDFDLAQKLHSAAEGLEMEAYLVLADIHESWDTDGDYYDDYRNRKTQTKEPKPTYMIVDETTVSHFLDRKNKSSFSNSLYVDDKCILRNIGNNALTPAESDYEGWMGNYGNTLEYWYRRAGVILWHKEDRIRLIFEFDTTTAINELNTAVKQNDLKFIKNSLKTIVEKDQRWFQKISDSHSNITSIIEICIAIDSSETAAMLLGPHIFDLFKPEIIPVILKLLGHYKSDWMISLLETKRISITNQRWGKTCTIDDLKFITTTLIDCSEGITVCHWLTSFSLSQFIDDVQLTIKYSNPKNRKVTNKKFLKSIEEILGSALEIKTLENWEKLLDFLATVLTEIDPVDIFKIIGNIKNRIDRLPKFKKKLMQLNKTIIVFLKDRIKELEPIKNSWAVLEEPSCTCILCDELKLFLASATEKEKKWPIGEPKRRHVQDEIKNLCLSIKAETVREGSPHKLVLSKQDGLISQKVKLLKSYKQICEIS
jgi:predicted 2-oxoglutarate/Fe(II)-dependent dioxygenase YbiX